jgi:outer membrane protein W
MVGYSTPQDLDGTASVSVHAELENPNTRLHLVPNMMYWNVDRVRDVAPNLDAYYHFNPDSKVTPYVGGGMGLNFVRDERFGVDRSSTDLGMNVVTGVRFPQSTNHYFIEGRYTASDISQVSLRTGMTFGTQ